MKQLHQYIEQLEKIERYELYSKGIHQATIDLVQESILELQQWNMLKEDDKLPLPTIIGALSYQVTNILEICDKSYKDYGILTEMSNVLNEK